MSGGLILIGEVIIDYSLSINSKSKMRLGGIIHAARGAWAVGIKFSVAYYAPKYLISEVENYLKDLGCKNSICLGHIDGSPNAVIIKESKEIGDQGYDFILQDQKVIINNDKALAKLKESKFDKSLIIWGEFPIHPILSSLNEDCLLYIDPASSKIELSTFKDFNSRSIETLFISTSTEIFKKEWKGSLISLFNLNNFSIVNNFILKENRGGSRLITRKGEILNCPSFEREIIHSVGVGDVYDTIFTIFDKDKLPQYTLNLSSLIASEYASTTYVNDFQERVNDWIKIEENQISTIKGTILPWEIRNNFKIYIAAPDFSSIDTRAIDNLSECLKYHNFKPFRPIKENGEISESMLAKDKRKIVRKDLNHLDSASIVIAVLLYNDPGTICEVGYAYSKGIPVLLYDPYSLAKNEMFKLMCKDISDDLEIIITNSFSYLGRISA